MLWTDLISLTYSVHPKTISSHQDRIGTEMFGSVPVTLEPRPHSLLMSLTDDILDECRKTAIARGPRAVVYENLKKPRKRNQEPGKWRGKKVAFSILICLVSYPHLRTGAAGACLHFRCVMRPVGLIKMCKTCYGTEQPV